MFSMSQPCSRVRRPRQVVEDPCPTCQRQRRSPHQTKRYRVKIPAGVREGSRIRLAGKGEPGSAAAPPATCTSSRGSRRRRSSSARATTSRSRCRSRSSRPTRAARSRSRRSAARRRSGCPAGTSARQRPAAARRGPGEALRRRARRHPLPLRDRRSPSRSRRSSRRRWRALQGHERQPARRAARPGAEGGLMATRASSRRGPGRLHDLRRRASWPGCTRRPCASTRSAG